MKTKYAVFLVLLFLYSCGGQKQLIVDTISNSVQALTVIYQDTERALIALNESGILTGQPWEQVKEKNVKEVDPAMRVIWKAWEKVPDTAGAVDDFLITPDFAKALALVLDLARLVPNPSNVEKLEKMQNQVLELKAKKGKISFKFPEIRPDEFVTDGLYNPESEYAPVFFECDPQTCAFAIGSEVRL